MFVDNPSVVFPVSVWKEFVRSDVRRAIPCGSRIARETLQFLPRQDQQLAEAALRVTEQWVSQESDFAAVEAARSEVYTLVVRYQQPGTIAEKTAFHAAQAVYGVLDACYQAAFNASEIDYAASCLIHAAIALTTTEANVSVSPSEAEIAEQQRLLSIVGL